MRSDLLSAIDAFDRVVAAAEGLVDAEVLAPVAKTVRATRDRVGYLGDTLVAAVAGGTGSGKSSLVNALAGEVVTESGGMRPTTGSPVAWIPANPEPGLTRLLDSLGVETRVGQDQHDWLALIDLPDTDSVVVDHRHTVQALLPRVDLVIWVIDPEKYQDRILHHDYLRPLAAYHEQFVFVLNQIDRISGSALEAMVTDLVASLEADGIADPRVVPLAADPPAGPPIEVDRLIDVLDEIVDGKRTVYRKLAIDLAEAARAVGGAPELAGGVGFEPRWEVVRRESATRLAAGNRTESESAIAGFVDELSAEVGGGAASELRSELSPETIARGVSVAYESSGAFRDPDPPAVGAGTSAMRWVLAIATVVGVAWLVDTVRVGGQLVWPTLLAMVAAGGWIWSGSWLARRRARATARAREEHRAALVDPIARQLDTHLGRPMRQVLRRRAGASAAVTELRLALAELERHFSPETGPPPRAPGAGM